MKESDRWKMGVAIGVVAVALAVGGYMMFGQGGGNPPGPRVADATSGGNGQDSMMGTGTSSGADNPALATGGTTTPAAAAAQTPTKEDTDRKVVPVLSIGDGIRIGAVLVGGPKSYVAQTKAVVAVEGDWKNAILFKALIPISTEKVLQHIERVPFVGVIGVVDLKVS